MKILNLNINNRVRYALNFDKKQANNVDFVVPKQDNSLFAFLKTSEDKVLIRTQEGEKKYSLDYVLDGNELRVDLLPYQSGQSKGKQPKKPTEILIHDKQWSGMSSLDYLRVVFVLHDTEQENIEREIRFTLCELTSIFNVVLDFGSEASQMAISRRGGTIGLNAVTNIFSTIKNRFGESSEEDDKYVQHEKGTTQLYRSIYYVKKDIESAVAPEPWDTAETDVMSFLSKRSSLEELKQDYTPLPNAKIASFGGVAVPQIRIAGIDNPILEYGDDFFYRKAVDLFINEALSIIQNRLPGQKKAVNICILMPNVYPLTTINKKLSDMADDIRHMLDSIHLDTILGFELTYASESDASMLGLFAANILEAFTADAGNYLIMDAGKGTLDFSILKYDPKQTKRYKNLCRSGIVGAGQAITYAIALALVREFIEQNCEDFDNAKVDEQVKDVVFNHIYKGDIAEQFDFWANVEEYKKKYNENDFRNKRENPEPSITLDKVQLRGVNNFIKSLDYQIPDPQNYIDNEIKGIALDVSLKLHQVTNRISTNSDHAIKIDKVIFTGRGFLMRAFREQIQAVLLAMEPGIQDNVITLSEKMPGFEKSICLYIAGLLAGGSYDVSLDGTPVLLEKKRKQESGKVASKKETQDQSGTGQVILEFVKTFGNIMNIIAPNTEEDETEFVLAGNVDSTESARITTFADIVNIGGVPYGLPNLPEKALHKSISFIYDGEEFLIQQGNQEYRFADNKVNLQRWHDFESIFPNVNISNASQVVIPPTVNEKWREMTSPAPSPNPDVPTKEESVDGDQTEGSFFENFKHLFRFHKKKQ